MPSEPVLKVWVRGGMALSDLPDVLGIEERGAANSGDNKTLQEVSMHCSGDYRWLTRQG